ncbi:MAG: hypothetical protein HFI91_00305 [Lachnospiraceae bacterium]|jgi:cell wall-associated NlpC family hydrolase|nr:hypothetical protein [Lachnospiraceae bacterium]
MKKRVLCTLLAVIIGLSQIMPACAATIPELKKQLEDTQNQLNAINGQAAGLEGQKDALEEEIDELDGVLVELISSISLLEEEIENKKDQIVQVQEELDAAIIREETQYEAMKKRIKFMYEKGNSTYAQLLFESKSISDMMNKADYIEKLYAYDRKLLIRYQETRQEVADLKEALEEEKSALEAEEYELKEEEAALEEALEAKRAEADNFEVQIAQIRQSAAAYKALIKQQTAQIKQLEAEEAARRAKEEAERKAREEAERKKREEANKKNNNSDNKSEKKDENKNTTTNANTGTSKPASAEVVSMINGASGSAKGKEVASFACRFIGNPYVPGGTSLTNGADCSGFTQAVYREFGISIPRNSSAQRGCGTGVSYADAQPGDLICYAGHVGMYIGNGYIVHASTQRTGIKITPATYKEILAVRRVL